jgi:hypothetical protein
MKEHLAEMREMGTEGIYYGGYGCATFHFAGAFKALDWDPPASWAPRSCSIRTRTSGPKASKAGSVDQLGDDGTNPTTRR